MSNQDMITAILSSIQTEGNLELLLRAMIANNLPNVSTIQLQNLCAALGIPTA